MASVAQLERPEVVVELRKLLALVQVASGVVVVELRGGSSVRSRYTIPRGTQ